MSDLTLNDDLPFPLEHEDAFVIELAIRMNPVFGASLSPESLAAHQTAMRRLRAAYRQSRVVSAELAVLNLSTQAIPTRLGAA